jgi:putative addiction module CopG family antidote
MAQTLQVSISDQAKSLIDQLVESGRYASADEVVTSALALMRPASWNEAWSATEVHRQIELGMQSIEREGVVPGHMVKSRLQAIRESRTKDA